MESSNIKKIITDFEELIGYFKDAKDFNCIITNILKKKNVKNKIEVIISFLDNLTDIKHEVKTNKKLDKTVFSLLQKENGEEKFIREFFSKLEDRSCSNILDPLRENASKFSKFGNLITNRLNKENPILIENFSKCKNHAEFIRDLFNSKFIEENIIHLLFEFWNKLTPEYIKQNNTNDVIYKNTIFENKADFKGLFLEALKNEIKSQRYSRIFIEEMKKKKIPREIENVLIQLNYTTRLKIDTFFEEFTEINSYKSFLDELFRKHEKFHIIDSFFESINLLKSEYDKERFNNTIFSDIYNEDSFGTFCSNLSKELCVRAFYLFRQSKKLYYYLKSNFMDNEAFIKEMGIYKSIVRLRNISTIELLENIIGHNYKEIAKNIIINSFDEEKIFAIIELLKNQLQEEVLNFIVIDEKLSKNPTFIDILSNNLDFFLINLIDEIIKSNHFKKQKVILLNYFLQNWKNITNNQKELIKNIKEQQQQADLKEIKFLYSRFLSYEIDLFYLLDFFPRYDLEKLSLLINRLIRSKKYEEALVVIFFANFEINLYIEKEHEDELFAYFNNHNMDGIKRKIRYDEREEMEEINHDFDYDENYDELNQDNSLSVDESENDEENANNFKIKKRNTYSNQNKKKILDYIMYFKYGDRRFFQQKYKNLVNMTNFMPNKRIDIFSSISIETISLSIPLENIHFIDNLAELKKIETISSKILGIDFEYADDTISIMQISDNNSIYIIDYLKLILFPEFFKLFKNCLKNCTFLAFDMSSSDMNLLNEEFRQFFSEVKIEDLKLIYNEKNKTKNCPSLSNMCFSLFGKSLCKYYQCSNWAKRPLLNGQIHYAALDCHILFDVYKALNQIDSTSSFLRKKECEKINEKEKKSLKEAKKINLFAKEQISFLEAERRMIEEMNKTLEQNSIEEIIQTHRVLCSIKFQEYVETEKIYYFHYDDLLTLIKKGEKAGLFSINNDGSVKELARGEVDQISPNIIGLKGLKLEEDTKLLKNFFKKKKICLIQISDDGFKSMIRAMKKLLCLDLPKYCIETIKICFPHNAINFDLYDLQENEIKRENLFIKRLNENQRNVLNFTLQSNHPISLIYGPPGTGKSKLIKEIILQGIKQNKKLLVTAFSNAGCDNIADIYSSTFELNFPIEQFLRIGKTSRTKPEVKAITMEERENISFYKICLLKIQETSYNKEDKELIDRRKNELENKLNRYREILIQRSKVVFSTCVSSGSFIMKKYLENDKNFFDVVIIDEASQALEASCWIPMLLGKKVIIVGDFNQIGPIVNTNTRITFTLFERLYKIYKERISKMLIIQYRMHEKIMKFPSNHFYDMKLIADNYCKDRTLKEYIENVQNSDIINSLSSGSSNKKDIFSKNDQTNLDSLNILKEPLILVNTEQNFVEEKFSTSKYNAGEALIVKFFVDYLCKNGLKKQDIGIITPYNGQVNYIQRILNEKLDVSTVDAFQGSEKEVIILSFVRSNFTNEVGFLADKKRINVAITRAKKMLIIICDPETLQCNNFLKEMIAFYLNNAKEFKVKELLNFISD